MEMCVATSGRVVISLESHLSSFRALADVYRLDRLMAIIVCLAATTTVEHLLGYVVLDVRSTGIDG